MSNLLHSVKAAGLNINSGSHDLMYVKYDALIVTHQHSIIIIIIISEICSPVELKCSLFLLFRCHFQLQKQPNLWKGFQNLVLTTVSDRLQQKDTIGT